MTMVEMSRSTALLTRMTEVAPSRPQPPAGDPPRRPGTALVDGALAINQRYAATVLRLALAAVFVWFGALKLVGSSPVHDLIGATLPFADPDLSVPVLGAVEVVIGLVLATGFLPRVTLLVLVGHLAGTFLTFVTASELMWSAAPFELTADGEFVVKNLVLISAALVLMAGYSRRTEDRATA
jgi:putative oxidoreductase